jgi:hypothetical protein
VAGLRQQFVMSDPMNDLALFLLTFKIVMLESELEVHRELISNLRASPPKEGQSYTSTSHTEILNRVAELANSKFAAMADHLPTQTSPYAGELAKWKKLHQI